jgi:glycosyltransferase involved in cell wall biosynthesis
VRILHVSEVHWGGVVTLLRHFTEQQAKHGHEVHLLAPPAFPRLDAAHQHAWGLVRENPRTFMPAVRELHALTKSLNVDVLHLHSSFAGFLGRLPVPGSAGKPVVFQPHAWAFDRFDDPRRRGATVYWERYAARRTTRIVANCADEIAQGRENGIHTPGSVLGIAVDTAHYRPPTVEERAAAKAELGFAGRQVILVVGRITYQKGQDLLVPAWERAPVPGAHLVLVGPGNSDDLSLMAPRAWNETIHHVGESQDIRRWLWAADVVTLPSRYEGFPLSVAETLACGVPVVATRFNGAHEVIVDGPAGPGGEVVPLGDMGALLRACAERLQSSARHESESRNGRRRAEERFQPEDVYARLQGAYEQAAGVAPAETA